MGYRKQKQPKPFQWRRHKIIEKNKSVWLSGDPLSPLISSAAKDTFATRRGRTRTEAVFVFPLALTRLISPFHNTPFFGQ